MEQGLECSVSDLNEAFDDVAFDELAALARCGFEGRGGYAIDVAEAAKRRFVQHRDGVAGEDLAFDSVLSETVMNVISGVIGAVAIDSDSTVQSGVERPVAAHLEAIFQLGETDQDNAQPSAPVPLVVEQHVKMFEHRLLKQLGLIEQKDGVHTFSRMVFDIRGNGPKDGAGISGCGDADRVAELTIEVTAPQRYVMTISKPETGLG